MEGRIDREGQTKRQPPRSKLRNSRLKASRSAEARREPNRGISERKRCSSSRPTRQNYNLLLPAFLAAAHRAFAAREIFRRVAVECLRRVPRFCLRRLRGLGPSNPNTFKLKDLEVDLNRRLPGAAPSSPGRGATFRKNLCNAQCLLFTTY